MKKLTPSKFRIINAAIYINKVIIRDNNILSNIKEFAKNFAKIKIINFTDLYSKYN